MNKTNFEKAIELIETEIKSLQTMKDANPNLTVEDYIEAGYSKKMAKEAVVDDQWEVLHISCSINDLNTAKELIEGVKHWFLNLK